MCEHERQGQETSYGALCYGWVSCSALCITSHSSYLAPWDELAVVLNVVALIISPDSRNIF